LSADILVSELECSALGFRYAPIKVVKSDADDLYVARVEEWEERGVYVRLNNKSMMKFFYANLPCLAMLLSRNV